MVLLRHGASRLYFGGAGFWVGEWRLALDLETMERAVEVGRKVGGDELEVLSFPGEVDGEFVVRLKR